MTVTNPPDLAFMPRITRGRHHPGEPVNLVVEGTRDQLVLSMQRAGWTQAVPMTFLSAIRIAFDSVFGRPDPNGPVSALFLLGRRQDLAFEKAGRTARQRDHVRFWDTGRQAADGQEIWGGAATRDVSIGLSHYTHLPTHHIAAHIDEERDLVANGLVSVGAVEGTPWQRGALSGKNAYGDAFVTDGAVRVLSLA